MTHAGQVLLILGAGKNIGYAIAQAAIKQGYTVVTVSRSGGQGTNHISADLSDPDAVVEVFKQVTINHGSPSVVIYNAAVGTIGDEKSPLDLPTEDLIKSLNVNTISPYTAAQEATRSWEKLPGSKTFIYTGNFLNTAVVPQLVQIGMSKTATAHMIEAAAAAYQDRGYRFYYVDERRDDGVGMWDGPGGDAAATYYLELANDQQRRPWLQTFVAGKGYKDFL